MLHEDIEVLETPVEEKGYSKKRAVITALSPAVLLTPLLFKNTPETYTTTTIPVTAPIANTPLIPVPSPFTTESVALLQTPVVAQPTGIIADTSLDMLANILDPLVQIMVAISFPIASVIMVGSCFFFMFGNSEKAWSGIMKAGLGYVIIQMSPLFLSILRQVGEAV